MILSLRMVLWIGQNRICINSLMEFKYNCGFKPLTCTSNKFNRDTNTFLQNFQWLLHFNELIFVNILLRFQSSLMIFIKFVKFDIGNIFENISYIQEILHWYTITLPLNFVYPTCIDCLLISFSSCEDILSVNNIFFYDSVTFIFFDHRALVHLNCLICNLKVYVYTNIITGHLNYLEFKLSPTV